MRSEERSGKGEWGGIYVEDEEGQRGGWASIFVTVPSIHLHRHPPLHSSTTLPVPGVGKDGGYMELLGSDYKGARKDGEQSRTMRKGKKRNKTVLGN